MSLPALAAVCLLIVTFCYVVTCWLSPFGNCRKCKGFGHKVKITRRGRVKRGRVCRRCHGDGMRIRIGRRLHNRTRRLHLAATQHTTRTRKATTS